MVSSPSVLIAAPTSVEDRERVQNVMENVCRSCITVAPNNTLNAKPGLGIN